MLMCRSVLRRLLLDQVQVIAKLLQVRVHRGEVLLGRLLGHLVYRAARFVKLLSFVPLLGRLDLLPCRLRIRRCVELLFASVVLLD